MGRAIIIKGAQIKRKSSQNAPIVSYKFLKGVQLTKEKQQAFRQHVVDIQTSYASILRQNAAPPQPQDRTFTFSAEQLVELATNVAIQVTQPQVCH